MAWRCSCGWDALLTRLCSTPCSVSHPSTPWTAPRYGDTCGCVAVAVAVCVMWPSRLVCLCPQLVVQPRDNDFSRRVCALLSALRESCSQQPKLHVVRAGQNNAAEVRFLWRLVEDPASYPGGKISYKDFYGQIHRESQQAAPAPGTGVHTGAAGFAGARRG